MSNEVFRWLLNIESIPPDAESVRLAWENPWPAWAWVLAALATAFVAAWSYRRLVGRRSGRVTLAILRSAVIALILLLISGPMLEVPRESIERDWVLVLVDRSASMNIADAPEQNPPRGNADSPAAQRITRDEQARRMLSVHADTFAALAEQRQVHWLGFHAGAFPLATTPSGEGVPDRDRRRSEGSPTDKAGGEASGRLGVDLGEADGRHTNIGTAIDQALHRGAARPISGIVLISDGRTSDPPSRALLRRLQADAVPLFPVPVGADEPLADIAIRRVDAPRRAFIGDKVPIVVQLDRLGEDGAHLPATVRLIDEISGEELDRVDWEGTTARRRGGTNGHDEIVLTAEPDLAGQTMWKVRVESEHPPLVPENAERTFAIELIDRPLRVLYVDGYPRWEYRYLKNLLIRERSIESSVMLLSADREFAQEGDVPIARLPRSPGEFAEFDVIVIGDVPAGHLSQHQYELIRDQVADRGAGLLVIGGERHMPAELLGTALQDLMPMRLTRTIPVIGRPVQMQPTDLAERLGVLQLVLGVSARGDAERINGGDAPLGSRLSRRSPRSPRSTPPYGWPAELSDPQTGWASLHWAQRLSPETLKPGVEVLAETADEQALPLVTLMRFGAGRTIYVGTDEIWRWRYGRGETLPEQFWVQMIRMLGRETAAAAGESAILETAPRRVEMRQPLRIDLRLLDAQLVDDRRASVSGVIETVEGQPVAEIELIRIEGADAAFGATFLPDAPGHLRVRLTEPDLAPLGLEASAEVMAGDDELRRPETDHELLAQLASATGGRMLGPDELADLPELLPNRALRTVNPLTERIWDAPLFFFLALILLTVEWTGRKLLTLA